MEETWSERVREGGGNPECGSQRPREESQEGGIGERSWWSLACGAVVGRPPPPTAEDEILPALELLGVVERELRIR